MFFWFKGVFMLSKIDRLGDFNNFKAYFDKKFEPMKKNCFSDVNNRKEASILKWIQA